MFRFKIGFHARDFEEFKRVVQLETTNLVELKPENWARNGKPFYTYEKGLFKPNHQFLEKISSIANDNDVQVHIHLPFEEEINPDKDTGICQAINSHHQFWLRRLHMFGELQEKYGIGNVLTNHGPMYIFEGKTILSLEDALKEGEDLYYKADEIIEECGYDLKIGIENIVGAKLCGGVYLGSEAWHIGKLIGKTFNVGGVLDSGHRVLNKSMSASEFVSAAHLYKVHLHTNPGVEDLNSYKDDEHLLAYRHNLPNYDKYVRRIRMDKLPVVLEISKINKFTNDELNEYIINLRKDIGNGKIV